MKNTAPERRLEFLTTISAKKAQEIINSYDVELGCEYLRLEEATGRILAEDLFSPEDFPYFDRSLVDGYAVSSKDTFGASETSPVMLQKKGNIKVGEFTDLVLNEGECAYVSTGAAIPKGADSVVMQEFSREIGDLVEILRPVHSGENVIRKGEDIEKKKHLFSKGRRISPFDIGILAALGLKEVPIIKKPRVGIISTGDEIIPPEFEAQNGKVRDVNGYVLIGLFQKLGGEPVYAGIAKDEIKEVTKKISSIRECDIFAISGGSSKGERDIIVEAIKELGGKVLFHGVNIKPGKPFFYGIVWEKPIFGLPGHPLSCIIVTHKFLLPLFFKIAGERERRLKTIRGVLTTNVPSAYGVEEYVNVKVRFEKDLVLVDPIFAKSATIYSLSNSSGYIIVNESREGYEEGEEVQVFLYEL